MSDLLKPCAGCGELSPTAWCTTCRPPKAEPYPKRPRQLGYDTTWDKLSRRARRIQDWCTDCGTRDDLTCDHSPEAWQRKADGLPIRLDDVDVVCRSCNGRRGRARPTSTQGEDLTPKGRGTARLAQISLSDGPSTGSEGSGAAGNRPGANARADRAPGEGVGS